MRTLLLIGLAGMTLMTAVHADDVSARAARLHKSAIVVDIDRPVQRHIGPRDASRILNFAL